MVSQSGSALTYYHHQPVFGPALPAVGRDLLVRGHVGRVVQLALLALVHGLVGLLVPPAETEAPPEPGWRSGRYEGGRGKQRQKKKH